MKNLGGAEPIKTLGLNATLLLLGMLHCPLPVSPLVQDCSFEKGRLVGRNQVETPACKLVGNIAAGPKVGWVFENFGNVKRSRL